MKKKKKKYIFTFISELILQHLKRYEKTNCNILSVLI